MYIFGCFKKSTTSKPAKHFEEADEVHPFAQSGYKLLQCNDEPLLYNVSRFTRVTGSIYMAHEFPTMIISSVCVFPQKGTHNEIVYAQKSRIFDGHQHRLSRRYQRLYV